MADNFRGLEVQKIVATNHHATVVVAKKADFPTPIHVLLTYAIPMHCVVVLWDCLARLDHTQRKKSLCRVSGEDSLVYAPNGYSGVDGSQYAVDFH